MRSRRWLVFVLVGVILGVVGATLLSSTAQFVAISLGVVVVGFALSQGMQGGDLDRSQDWPPLPAGGGGM
jgi:sulfite exporter TauE/SafE